MVDAHEACNEITKPRASTWRFIREVGQVLQCMCQVCQEWNFFLCHSFIWKWEVQSSTRLLKPITQELGYSLDLQHRRCCAWMKGMWHFYWFNCSSCRQATFIRLYRGEIEQNEEARERNIPWKPVLQWHRGHFGSCRPIRPLNQWSSWWDYTLLLAKTI